MPGFGQQHDALRHHRTSAPPRICHYMWCSFVLAAPLLLKDGVLDEMYGGGEGDADSGEEQAQEDSDEEDDAEMMEELMQEEAESGDEQVGGGIKHEDFFDDGDDE